MKKHRAFSLIETSVIILIIGILIVGIQQSIDIIAKARLKTARSLTESSPVASTDNLIAWYETSLESSFDEDTRDDETSIATWYDNNNQSPQKNNATQSTSGYQPIFYENIFNYGIPAVRFDGSDDYLDFDGDLLVGNDYTIFVVEQKRATISDSTLTPFISGSQNSSDKNLFFGYYKDTQTRLGHGGGTMNIWYNSTSDLPYSTPITRIHTGSFSSNYGMFIYFNGDLKNSDSSKTTTLVSYSGPSIGGRNISTPTFFNGDIAEIIIFNRYLSDYERNAIERYLGKKYSVSIE